MSSTLTRLACVALPLALLAQAATAQQADLKSKYQKKIRTARKSDTPPAGGGSGGADKPADGEVTPPDGDGDKPGKTPPDEDR